ncbi:MAG TPA: hypothetical protein VF779_08070, partial [Pyrinomonadaceae bacterium]
MKRKTLIKSSNYTTTRKTLFTKKRGRLAALFILTFIATAIESLSISLAESKKTGKAKQNTATTASLSPQL